MQYLVPLTNDEPFKKVFQDKEIAKAFLEDLLNVTIESIEVMEWAATDNKITNAAAVVRFDFRCKIAGQEVIIEVQQDYYDYLVRRFYLYHCLNTGLQLETIKDRTEKNKAGREVIIKRYTELRSVITIIWMVETNLGFDQDFVEFNTYPKFWADFMKNEDIWTLDKSEILEMRNQLLKHLHQKKDYDLTFHEQNRLIYVFQNNIVKNKKKEPYVKWFEFAQKTRKKDNKFDDFQEFIHNKNFSKMIQRLCTTYMEPDELRKMIGDEAYFAAKKLEEEDREADRLAKLKNDFYMAFGHELKEERGAAQWKLTMAYQEWGIEKRALIAEKKKWEQAHKETLEKEQEKEKLLLNAEKEREKAKNLLKAEKEKAKKEKMAFVKAEKEKQAQLLKAEKEKQAQLLKAEKENFQIKVVQKMLNAGNSIEMIADFLEVSAAQVQAWSKDLKK